MNEKLKSFSYLDLRTAPRSRRPSEALVSFSITREKHPTTRALVLSLHERALEQAGFKPGMTLAFDIREGAVCLYPHPRGRVIGLPNKKARCIRSRVMFTIPKEYAAPFDGVASEVEIAPGRIAFIVAPK